MNRAWAVPLAVALALVTAGCATGEAQQQAHPETRGNPAKSPDADVVIVARDVAFVNPPQQMRAGTITVALDNRGQAPHDITFQAIGTVAAAGGGGKATAQVTLEPGTYVVYCSVPGHRTAGMKFEVTVR